MTLTRFWHKLKAWFGMHPGFYTGLGVFAAVVAVVGLALTLYLHSQDAARIRSQKVADQADKRARQEAEQTSDIAIRATLCPLIYAYTHPVTGTLQTGRTDQIAAGWQGVGALIGCPEGIKPKGP